MSDLNRRFSRSQFTRGGSIGHGYANYGNGNGSNIPATSYQFNATTSSLSINEINENNTSNISSTPNNGNVQHRRSTQNYLHPNLAGSSESIHSTATNATSATTRRRFSVKLSQPPTDGYNTYGAPALPYNAQSQIYNSADMQLNDSSHGSHGLSTIQQTRFNNYTFGDTNENLTESSININNRSPKKTNQDILIELTDQNFDAARYVHMKLGDANAARIDDFSTHLETLNKANDDAVKYSLSESTNQVLAVSEAFKQTHEVLLTLKPKVNDLSDLLSQQLEEAHEYQNKSNESLSDSTDGSSSKLNRQSVMLLQNKWSNSMKKLYANIDRSHDLLPPISTRHIIIESRRWGELNSITCNPIRPIHIVVMNDSILIASRVRDTNKYLSSNDKKGDKSSKRSKHTRNIATHVWMIDTITVQRCSEIKELNDILSNNHLNNAKNRNQSTSTRPGSVTARADSVIGSDDSESAADLTICIRTLDSNQTFLFQTDLNTEFIRVFNAIQQAKAESSSMKRRSMRDSMSKFTLSNLNTRPDSRRVSGTGLVSSGSTSLLEKQIEPEFNSKVSTIDDLLTSASLELGLERYDECVGYLSRLDDEIRQLTGIASTIGIPKSLLSAKSLTSSKNGGLKFSIFSQHVHLIYNLKVSSLKQLTDQLVNKLLEEISLTTASLGSLKEFIDIFRILKREREAVEVYLESRGRELSDCVGMVRVGGGNNANGSDSVATLNNASLNMKSRPLSRSNSTKSLHNLSSRPSSVNLTSTLELDLDGDETLKNKDNINLESIGGVTGELITAYVRELSLVYMGFISRVWTEWNDLFPSDNNNNNDNNGNVPNSSSSGDSRSSNLGVSKVRVIEWVNDCMSELKNSVMIALADYDRNGEVFKSSVSTMTDVFETLKERELNVDYLLEI